MSKIIYVEISTTERRTHLGGTTLDEHRELIAKGFHHDRMANQYRKTGKEFATYQDGVLIEPCEAAFYEAAEVKPSE